MTVAKNYADPALVAYAERLSKEAVIQPKRTGEQFIAYVDSIHPNFRQFLSQAFSDAGITDAAPKGISYLTSFGNSPMQQIGKLAATQQAVLGRWPTAAELAKIYDAARGRETAVSTAVERAFDEPFSLSEVYSATPYSKYLVAALGIGAGFLLIKALFGHQHRIAANPAGRSKKKVVKRKKLSRSQQRLASLNIARLTRANKKRRKKISRKQIQAIGINMARRGREEPKRNPSVPDKIKAVSGMLKALGFTAASKDVRPQNVSRYARIVINDMERMAKTQANQDKVRRARSIFKTWGLL